MLKELHPLYQRLEKFLKNLIVVTIPTFIVFWIVLELFLTYVIPAAQFPAGYFDEKTRIFKLWPNQEGVYTMGWLAQQRAIWRTNNQGWNSPINYRQERSEKNKKRIAIIGDSFVEALQVDVDKSYPSLLRENLGDEFEVLSFGKAGAPLSQYLHVSRYITATYKPDILIFNVVHNDFEESLAGIASGKCQYLTCEVAKGKVSEKQPRPDYSFQQYNWKRRVLIKSSVIRYLYRNLDILAGWWKLKAIMGRDRSIDVEVDRLSVERNLVWDVTEYILYKIRAENMDKGIIVVMDAPRRNIYDGCPAKGDVLYLHQMMDKLCKKLGLEFLDLTVPMRKDYETNGVHFEGKYDWHWNEYGHRFVFKQLCPVLIK